MRVSNRYSTAMPPESFDEQQTLLNSMTCCGSTVEGGGSIQGGLEPDAVCGPCAFANDFENLGGGYVVIGQDCVDGKPVFPPVGLNDNQLDPIQRELLGFCNLIQPTYFPILSVEKYEGKNLIVLWSPGGQNRPYKAPRAVTAKAKEYHYYIRRFSSTVEVRPNSEDEQELLRLSDGAGRRRQCVWLTWTTRPDSSRVPEGSRQRTPQGRG